MVDASNMDELICCLNCHLNRSMLHLGLPGVCFGGEIFGNQAMPPVSSETKISEVF